MTPSTQCKITGYLPRALICIRYYVYHTYKKVHITYKYVIIWSPYQILDNDAIVYMCRSKWTSHHISNPRLRLRSGITLNNWYLTIIGPRPVTVCCMFPRMSCLLTCHNDAIDAVQNNRLFAPGTDMYPVLCFICDKLGAGQHKNIC
jgi:hypothetical protein